MLRAFHFNLAALSYVALVGGLFLVYNTVAVSVIGYRCRSEVAMLTSQRRLRLRTGMGRFCYERFVPFSSVRAVVSPKRPSA